MTGNPFQGFRDPAAGGDAALQQRFLADQETDPRLADRYRQKYELLALKPGERVLDLGCGNGSDVMRMAPLVGPTGQVVGIDVNPAMVDATAVRAQGAGFANVETSLASDQVIPFPDNSFDAVHTERVLIWVANPETMVKELTRVVRPGGRVVCLELDHESRYFDFEDMRLHDAIYQHGTGNARGRAGRQLARHFRRAGLVDVEVRGFVTPMWGPDFATFSSELIESDLRRAISEGSITEAEAEAFRTELSTKAAAGEFFSASVAFLTRGIKTAASTEA